MSWTSLLALWVLGSAGAAEVGPCLEPAHCLHNSALALLDRIDARDIPIVGESLLLVRDPKAPPSSAPAKDLTSRIAEFLKTRSLLLKIPQVQLDSDSTQGRKDKGDKGGYGAMAMMMGGTLLAMGFAALAALAGKALAASMAALMMAAMAAMKKHGGGGHGGYEVITVGGGGHHHHRSLHIPQEEHEAETDFNEPYNQEAYPRNDK